MDVGLLPPAVDIPPASVYISSVFQAPPVAGLGLPVRIEMDPALISDALRKDKKRQGGEINFVLLDGIGSARVEPIGINELEWVIDDLRQSR